MFPNNSIAVEALCVQFIYLMGFVLLKNFVLVYRLSLVKMIIIFWLKSQNNFFQQCLNYQRV